MEVLKFGFGYWKKNLPMAILIQLCSYIAIICDLMLPLISEMFIDYVILDHSADTSDNIFAFMLSGKYGEVHTMRLFFSLAVIFMILLSIRLVLVYFKNVTSQKLGVKLETDLRRATFRKIMELDSETLAEFNTGELLTTANADTVMYKELFCTMVVRIFDSIFVLAMCIYFSVVDKRISAYNSCDSASVFAVALISFRKKKQGLITEI